MRMTGLRTVLQDVVHSPLSLTSTILMERPAKRLRPLAGVEAAGDRVAASVVDHLCDPPHLTLPQLPVLSSSNLVNILLLLISALSLAGELFVLWEHS